MREGKRKIVPDSAIQSSMVDIRSLDNKQTCKGFSKQTHVLLFLEDL